MGDKKDDLSSDKIIPDTTDKAGYIRYQYQMI